MKPIAPAITMLLLAPAVLCAGSWTEFRGPSGQGHSTEQGLPVKWDTETNVVWKTPLPGLGWSSPVILNGKVFVTTAVSDKGTHQPDQSLRVICLDEKSGDIDWNVEVFAQKSVDRGIDRVHRKNSQASPTPITDGKHLFVHFGTRGTACLTLDGKPVWKNQEIVYTPVHGNGGSPILVDDLLVFSCDGGSAQFIVALDTTTGDIRWKSNRAKTSSGNKFAFGTPLLIEVEGQKQIVSQAAGAVFSYHPKDGSMIWRVDYGQGYSVIPRPVYAHGLVYISSGYNKPTLYAIDPTGKGDVTETHVKWTYNRAAPHTPSPLAVGNELYLVSDKGIFTCLDAKTGDVHYQQRMGEPFSASPLFADGHIYIQSETGTGTVIKPGVEYEAVGSNRLEGRTFASYAVSDRSLFIRTEQQLYRFANSK